VCAVSNLDGHKTEVCNALVDFRRDAVYYKKRVEPNFQVLWPELAECVELVQQTAVLASAVNTEAAANPEKSHLRRIKSAPAVAGKDDAGSAADTVKVDRRPHEKANWWWHQVEQQLSIAAWYINQILKIKKPDEIFLDSLIESLDFVYTTFRKCWKEPLPSNLDVPGYSPFPTTNTSQLIVYTCYLCGFQTPNRKDLIFGGMFTVGKLEVEDVVLSACKVCVKAGAPAEKLVPPADQTIAEVSVSGTEKFFPEKHLSLNPLNKISVTLMKKLQLGKSHSNKYILKRTNNAIWNAARSGGADSAERQFKNDSSDKVIHEIRMLEKVTSKRASKKSSPESNTAAAQNHLPEVKYKSAPEAHAAGADVWFIMPFMGIPILGFFDEATGKPLPEAESAADCWATAAKNVFDFLHCQCRVIHRDVSVNNVLYDASKRMSTNPCLSRTMQICDFGTAREIPSKKAQAEGNSTVHWCRSWPILYPKVAIQLKNEREGKAIEEKRVSLTWKEAQECDEHCMGAILAFMKVGCDLLKAVDHSQVFEKECETHWAKEGLHYTIRGGCTHELNAEEKSKGKRKLQKAKTDGGKEVAGAGSGH